MLKEIKAPLSSSSAENVPLFQCLTAVLDLCYMNLTCDGRILKFYKNKCNEQEQEFKTKVVNQSQQFQ